MALETAARQGFSNGAFEESEEEGNSVVEEFYPEEGSGSSETGSAITVGKPVTPCLADKLADRASKLASDVT